MAFGFGRGREMQKMIEQNARPKRDPFRNLKKNPNLHGISEKKERVPLSEKQKTEIRLRLKKQREVLTYKIVIVFVVLSTILFIFFWSLF